MTANSAAIRAFSKKLTDTATVVQRSQRTAIEAAAASAKTALQAAPGAPTFLAGVGRRGARVGVRYDVRGVNNPTAIVKWYGPAHLVNNPTKPHSITPRRTRRARGNGPKAVLVNGQPFASAQHPGTRGKGFFQKGRPVANKVADEVYGRTIKTVLARRFVGG